MGQKPKQPILLWLRMLYEGFSNFISEGNTLCVINPIAFSFILPPLFVASIIVNILTLLSSVSF